MTTTTFRCRLLLPCIVSVLGACAPGVAPADARSDSGPFASTDGQSDFDVATDQDAGDEPAVDDAAGTDSGPVRTDSGRADAGGGVVIPRPTKPNIIVIMADDLDAASLETALARGLAPNIAQYIARPGMHFANNFASNPLCCPSRASFLTGRYPHNTDVQRNHGPHGGVEALNDRSTIATWLHEAGYRTGHVGKYLNGYGRETAPTYVPPGWDDWQATVAGGTYRMYDYDINDNGRIVHYDTAPSDYQTDVLARRAVQFVTDAHAQAPNKPLFLVVTPLAPHVEVGPPTDQRFGAVRPAPRHVGSVTLPLPMAPSFNEADITDKPDWIRDLRFGPEQIDDLQKLYRQRLAALRAVDDLVGDVVGALQRTGEWANTVLVFTADNGYLLGQHRHVGKQVAYEDSIRIPLYVRVPGSTATRATTQMTANEDLAPTFADLAGITPGHSVDGRSFVSILLGQRPAAWRARMLIEHMEEADTEDNDSVGLPDFNAVRSANQATVQPDRLFVRYTTGEREFYDLASDPHELVSRHADTALAGPISVMNGWRMDLVSCAGASCRSAEQP